MIKPLIKAIARPVVRALHPLIVHYLKLRGFSVVPARPDYFYNEEGLETCRNHDFVDDPRFREAIEFSWSEPFTQRFGHHGRWSFHISLWAASHAIALGADIVQLGVFVGSEAAAMLKFTRFEMTSQRMFLIDTFTGVPEEQWTKEELVAGAGSAQHMYKDAGDTYGYVSSRFRSYQNVSVIQGRVPDVLASIPVQQIGLLMLDLNAAAPERAAAEFLWEKIVPGGLILSDDYGHSRDGVQYIAQKRAFDDFARSRGVSVLSVPTGHGLIIKPS